MQMTGRYVKNCSTSVVTTHTPNQRAARENLPSVKVANYQKVRKVSVGEDVQKLEARILLVGL